MKHKFGTSVLSRISKYTSHLKVPATWHTSLVSFLTIFDLHTLHELTKLAGQQLPLSHGKILQIRIANTTDLVVLQKDFESSGGIFAVS